VTGCKFEKGGEKNREGGRPKLERLRQTPGSFRQKVSRGDVLGLPRGAGGGGQKGRNNGAIEGEYAVELRPGKRLIGGKESTGRSLLGQEVKSWRQYI